MVRCHVLRAESLAQLVRHALNHPARVDKNQGRAVQHHQFGHAVVDALPHVVRHDRLQRHRGQLQRQIARTYVADIDDRAFAIAIAIAIAIDTTATAD